MRALRDRSFRAGLVAIAAVGALIYAGFVRENPLADPYEVTAVMRTASNVQPRSPVRVAGVEVGKVTRVEAVNETGGARVVMEIGDEGLPLHTDAEVKIRPRVFLEGNFFVDLSPGSPSAPELEDGGEIPVTQTAAPVQFGDVLAALESDTRADLQTFLREYAAGLHGDGAAGFNASIRHWERAYRDGAVASEATLGADPRRDLRRVLVSQGRTFGALSADEDALRGLVSSLSATVGALAREDRSLAAAVPALRDTLRAGRPSLAAVGGSLPELRAFARDALPGVRSSPAALDASLPLLRETRALLSASELGGAARTLQRHLPSLVALNRTTTGFLAESRQLAACTNRVLVPFVNTELPDPELPGNSGTVNQKFQRAFVGLAGESRQADGNNSYFHTQALPPGERVRPAPPPGTDSTPPPHRPDLPCELQEPPDLDAPGGPISAFSGDGSGPVVPTRAERRRGFLEARRIHERYERALERLAPRLRAKVRREGGR